jgi:hypothetical protein
MEDDTVLSDTVVESVQMEISKSTTSTGSDARDEANATLDSTTEETSSSTLPPPKVSIYYSNSSSIQL